MHNVALLIDADNLNKPEWIEAILGEAVKLGTLALKRVYGDFSKPDKEKWREMCAKFAIQPIQQYPSVKGKNASDISLVIDAMDLLHSERYQSFVLVSSDSDFSRLATRIREDGLEVWGFGEMKACAAFVSSCSKFVYVEVLSSEGDSQDSNQTPSEKAASIASLKPLDKKLWTKFKKVTEQIADSEGWAALGGVGGRLGQTMPDFDSRNYGYAKLSTLVQESSWFETRKLKNGKQGIEVKLKLDGFVHKPAKAKS